MLSLLVTTSQAQPTGLSSEIIEPPVSLDECKPVDLRKAEFSMHGMPVRDQGKTGLCFSYVASQMVQAYTKSHGGPEIYPNPILTSVEMLREHEKPTLKNYKPWEDGGYVAIALEEIQKQGTCKAGDLGFDEYKLLNPLLEMQKLYEKRLDYRLRPDELARQICVNREYLPVKMKSLTDCSGGFSPLDLILEPMSNREFIRRAILAPCENPANRISVKVPKMQEKNSNFAKNLSDFLSRNHPQPVFGSLCMEFLQTGGKTKECSPHAVLMVGRRREGSRCQYLIRNSHGIGHGCYGLKAAKDCEHGEFWVDGDDLAKNLKQIGVLGDSQ